MAKEFARKFYNSTRWRKCAKAFAQSKLFKDTWETIPGNCDTFIYLGGNEQSTHKYVSELLGKGTIDKKSSG